MTNHDTLHHDSGEAQHSDLVARLHELGEHDRQGTPANLTDRLVLRTQANLGGHGDVQDPSPVVSVRSLGWMRAAAAVLIVGSVIAVIATMPQTRPNSDPVGPTTGPPVEYATAEFNLDLVDGSFWDDSFDGQIAVLLAKSTMLVGELDREWEDLDYLSDEGAL